MPRSKGKHTFIGNPGRKRIPVLWINGILTDNVIIAKDGDSVIGFVGFGKYRNDEPENAGEVFAIYILSQYYGKGIGYRLMQTALSELADHSKIAVWVLKENTKAIRFYERCGYRFDGREQIIELGSPVVAARMVLER